MDKALWGLSARFQTLAAQYPELVPGRVTAQEKGLYCVVTERGELSGAAVSGRFRHDAETVSDYPAVGDFVMLEPEQGGMTVIQRVLPRKSVFMRKAAGTARTEQVVAANIDTVFLCMSLNYDFNLRRLERYFSASWESGAVPVAVLTKADLCDDAGGALAAVRGVAAGADVVVTSSMEENGSAALAPYLTPGTTVAFVGSTGAGKSTLINRLLGEDRQKTGELRDNSKGRHTTTRRELMLLPCGAMVIDTPGMRELGLWDAAEGVSTAFADIRSLAGRCRFGDCTHTGEPGCAVLAALERGELDPGRLASYQKLAAENSYSEDAEAYLDVKRKRFKEIARINKAAKRK